MSEVNTKNTIKMAIDVDLYDLRTIKDAAKTNYIDDTALFRTEPDCNIANAYLKSVCAMLTRKGIDIDINLKAISPYTGSADEF